MSIRKLCNKSGCSNLISAGNRYCQKHMNQEQIDKKERNHYYDINKRNKEASRFYHSSEWTTVRSQAQLRDNYLCLDCFAEKRLVKADVVDHVLPIEYFPELNLTLSNLRSLCHAHHNSKTAEDKKRFGVK